MFPAACKVYDSDANLRGDNNNSNQIAENTANNQANQAKDDALELSKIINLPYVPAEEAVFREENVGEKSNQTAAANRKKLIAVLKFSDTDTEKIVAQSDQYPPAPAPAKLDVESWFPPELIAVSQESGDESLKGISYPANDFYSETYNNGKITRINNTDYFVLELFSK